jgi:hypothetical protein
MAYANPNYYWGYDSKAFRDLAAKHSATTGAKDRTKLFGDMQRMIANDSVNVFLFNATNTAVYQFTYFCQRHGIGFLELIHEDIGDRWYRLYRQPHMCAVD